LSRTGVSAIEAARLVPSVAAAIGLARALGCAVEDLFGSAPAAAGVEFAWQPTSFPCRYWAAEIVGRTLLFPVESSLQGGLMHDGIARYPGDLPSRVDVARTTLVLATCDPAAAYLASLYSRHGGFRMLVFTRASGEALALVGKGLAHVAGVHFAATGERMGNSAAIASRLAAHDLSLLHVAEWEEGLTYEPGARLRSAASAARKGLRWIGRSAGAGARRCQDELLGPRRPPRHVARDHRGVVEAIKSGWADVGVCVRLASEEGQLAFLSLGEESYDLCYRRNQAADPRIASLVRTVRSAEYRQLLADLPGYQAQPHLGEIEDIEAGKAQGHKGHKGRQQ
jgi:molybdate-binding protein/transcriptional regulator with XRE-family HTH domain